MKKVIIALLLTASLLALTACSKTEETSETTAADAAAETTVAADAAAEEETTAGTTDPDEINAAVDALDVTMPDSLGTVGKIGEYKGLELTATEHVTISDDDVLEYIEENILPNYTEEVTDAIKDGDVANIDYEGKKDGVAFDGGTAEGYDLTIGSGSFIDGFESGLIGHKAGETVDLNLTFPEDYSAEELAGQEVVFTVKINSVTRQKELSDEIAKDFGDDLSTVADLKNYVKEYLQAENDLNEQQELYYDAVSAVLENCEITPDQKAVDYTTNSYVQNYSKSLQNTYQIDLGTLLSYYGMSLEDFMANYADYADESVKQRLLLQEIAKKENITIDDSDIEAFAELYGYSVENLKETVGEELTNQLVLEDKANKFIVDNAKITYTATEEE